MIGDGASEIFNLIVNFKWVYIYFRVIWNRIILIELISKSIGRLQLLVISYE